MRKYIFLLLSLAFIVSMSSCSKEENNIPVIDELAQLKKDTIAIRNFLTKTNFSATKLGPTGVYYKIITEGEGSEVLNAKSKVKVKYTGSILDGGVFEDKMNTETEFEFGRLIPGWQLGLPLIKKGGQIRLIISSGYAYGPFGIDGLIPPNTNLDFNIKLIDIK